MISSDRQIGATRTFILPLALLLIGACAGFDCGPSTDRSGRPEAVESEEAPVEAEAEVEEAPALRPEESPPHHVAHDDHDDDHDDDHYTEESGDHALEVHSLHGHSATSVSEEKERALGGRLGVRRLPLVDPPSLP